MIKLTCTEENTTKSNIIQMEFIMIFYLILISLRIHMNRKYTFALMGEA